MMLILSSLINLVGIIAVAERWIMSDNLNRTLNDCRGAFEREAKAQGYSLAIVKTVPPKYHEGDTQTAWHFWQAAWSARNIEC
jgi:hypothetical protein